MYYLSNISYMFQCVPHHPQGELLLLAQNLSAYCNVVTFITKHKIYHMIYIYALYMIYLMLCNTCNNNTISRQF